jgi:hypothetical protein
MVSTYQPPWQHEFREGAPCLFCGTVGHTTLGSSVSDVGVCEACAAHAHWIWKTLSGDTAPVDRSAMVTSVKVVVARLIALPSGDEAVPEHPTSYQFLMGMTGTGNLDLPSASVLEGETEFAAVDRALDSAGLASWPQFVVPLYVAYTPRGSLTRIYLVKAYSVVSERPRMWRNWPPWQHARGMAGLYLGLGDVWPLLLAQHYAESPHTSQVTIHVRKGAVEYLKVQRALREGEPDVDTSMLEYLRKSMTDDERFVCKAIQSLAALEKEQSEEAIVVTEDEPTLEYRDGDEVSADGVEPEDDGETLEESLAPEKQF